MLKKTCIALLSLCVVIAIIFIVLMFIYPNSSGCKASITTASGFAAPNEICSGNLIFVETFSQLDKQKWKPEVTFWGGGNGEFQWYTEDDENSFVNNGKLFIKPTLTESKIGRDQVEHGFIHLKNCTDLNKENCDRQAGGNIIINPVRSARLITKDSFSFKYGRAEIIAKIPTGDWLWPAVWLLPTQEKYGGWPRSGEIDVMESRGNVKYGNNIQIGIEHVGSTLHFGPHGNQEAWPTSTYSKNNATGFNKDFHRYEFVWDETGIRFIIDGIEIGFVAVGDGFWARGDFKGDNIWTSGSKMAPFDEEFHFVFNLAIGGTSGYFPDVNNGNGKRPWNNTSPSAMKDFWINSNQWLTTWHIDTDANCLIIESVKVWAL